MVIGRERNWVESERNGLEGERTERKMSFL